MKPLAARLPLLTLLLVVTAAFTGAGCRTSRKVTVPQLLSPLVEADAPRLLAEVNRHAAVRSLRGKVDIQFLDTSFARCGVAEKYSTADGTVTVQRPGQINFVIQVPFIGTDVAQMTSDGQRFAVAVLQGAQKYRQFVRGSNAGNYAPLSGPAAAPQAEADCGGGDGRTGAMDERAVSALSSLRPQHLTDALLVPPTGAAGSDFIYALSETFEDEEPPPARAGEKRRNGRVVRGYYLLVELAPEGANRARVTRRFWFDRVQTLRLARIQTYDAAGRLITDVVYREAKPFGEGGRYQLPSVVELTRPQDRYSLRITYQAPDSVRVDQPYQADFFNLKNTWGLPEVDLDERLRNANAAAAGSKQ